MATFLGVTFVIICILLILVILLQKGRGGGIGAAFGGSSSSAFGTKTGDVLTWVTIVLTSVFLILAVCTTMAYRPKTARLVPPMFSPAPGAIDKETPITIRPGNSEKGSLIYFTVDGSEPTEKSARYHANPVMIQPNQTLKAKAFRRGFNPSETATATYPMVSATTEPAVEAPKSTSAPAATSKPAVDAPKSTTQPAVEVKSAKPSESKAPAATSSPVATPSTSAAK